jgi:Spy/CpxP family protein refolding chaperone
VETGMDELSDELQLTADQKSRLDQIFNDKHEKYRIIREETQSKIRALLSDEQLEKWNTLKRHSFDR